MAGRIAYYGGLVTRGLVFDMDAAKKDSYAGSGTTWYDISGNSSVGTLTNGPTFTTSGSGGIVFDGVDDYIAVGTNYNIPISSSAYTINVWFKPNSLTGALGLVGWGNYGSTNQVNAFRLSDNGFRHYWWGNDLDANAVGMSIGSWYNAVALFDGTTRQIWLNNSVKASNTPVGKNTVGTSNLTIGRTYNTEYFSGTIGSVQIYNVGLTSTEVAQNYNAYKGRYGL